MSPSNRASSMSSRNIIFKRDRFFNRGEPPRKNYSYGGWSVPPAYVKDVQDFRDYSVTHNEEKMDPQQDVSETSIDSSFICYDTIPEHGPRSTTTQQMNSSVSDSKDNKILHNIFSSLQFFRKTKTRELDSKQVVKLILEEGQMLKRQRIEMMVGWTGEVGLALFIPIDWEEMEDVVSSSSSSVESEGSESEDSLDGVTIEDDPDLESSPPILSNSQLYEIHSNGLPPAVALMTWTRAYSLNRDGDHFGTLMENVGEYQHTLTVIRTKNGDILGGYADTAWGKQRSASSNRARGSFFGGGRAFLFATKPDLDKEEEEMIQMMHGASHNNKICKPNNDTISFYPWTGVNDYNQICDMRKGTLGMGGGGAFGWFIQNNFTIGSSGQCMTFRNPPLTKGDDGNFKIVDLEIYGFKNMSERINSYSQSSLSERSGRQSRTLSLSSPSSTINSMFE